MRIVTVEGVRCLVACENPAGTAKWQGACDWLRRVPAGSRVVTWSSGGHGCSVALAAQRLGLRATVVIPSQAELDRELLLEKTAATLLRVDGTVDDCKTVALEQPGIPVPGFDDVQTIHGHRWLYRHASGDEPVFVPVGGGGLLAAACMEVGDRAVAVEHTYAMSLTESREAGHPVPVDPQWAPTGVRVAQVGRIPFEIILTVNPSSHVVDDRQVTEAADLLEAAGVQVEAAGAMALAAALYHGAGGWALVSGGPPQGPADA